MGIEDGNLSELCILSLGQEMLVPGVGREALRVCSQPCQDPSQVAGGRRMMTD
jgi:hypothetical protein